MSCSRDLIQIARRANLYDFLFEHYLDDFIQEYDSLRMRDNHSLSIRMDFSGYYDFATGEKGNSIDFLVRHMGYDFVSAVLALCGKSDAVPVSTSRQPRSVFSSRRPFSAPDQAASQRQLFTYLESRKIPSDLIQTLIDAKLLYLSTPHQNAVFINAARDWGEQRGTVNASKPYHGMIQGSRHNGYWSFSRSSHANTAYICEAAIDAISLFELHRQSGRADDGCYISIGGAGKQDTIERIKTLFPTVIIAADNDEAGAKCRARNADCGSIIPKHKDWNEDLQLGDSTQ